MAKDNATPAQSSGSGESGGDLRIVVVGSVNMDLVVRVPVMPSPGETVQGHSFSTIPGGKGANQAIAAAHCGAQVALIGRVGSDDFGERLLLGLQAHGVDTAAIMVSEGVSTGTAIIVVDDNGENAICVAPGANGLLSPEDIDEQMEVLAQAHLILLQLEIPPSTALYAIQQARRYQIPVILNPSPVPARLDPELLDVDILIPNEHEIAQITGEKGRASDDLHLARMAGFDLIRQGVKAVVVTLGPRGALGVRANYQSFHVPSFKSRIVDTTGAGDAFCGALAVAFSRDQDLHGAARFGAAAGALACNKFGAQPSLPRLEAIERLLQRSC